MIKVTPQIALLVFGIILVISALVAVMMKNYKSFDSGGFHTFIVILGGLGVFLAMWMNIALWLLVIFLVFVTPLFTGIPLSKPLLVSIGLLFVFDSFRRFGTSMFGRGPVDQVGNWQR